MQVSRKRQIALLGSLVLAGVWGLPAPAQTPATLNCASPQTTAEIRQCAGQEYLAADRRLNQLYSQLQGTLPAARRSQLVKAQLAWIQFRDAACAFESSAYAGGTLAPVVRTACLTRLTKQRVHDLEASLKPDR